jgi:uncharacterized protein YbaR (Trm112 family)
MRKNTKIDPLKISEMPAHHVNLREGERKSLVCPDCKSWHPIRRGIVWPHHLERTERGKNGTRCPGSARRVEMIDLDLDQWSHDVAEADATVKARRANRVTRKPKAPATPAVSQVVAPVLDAPTALRRYQKHRERCATCRPAGRTRCIDGARLAVLYARTQRTEPARRAIRAADEQFDRQAEWAHHAAFPQRRAQQWYSVLPAVETADIERVRDELAATLQELDRRLDRFERAALDQRIIALAEELRRL